MPRIIDRYILREILAPFALALLVFTFILEIPPIMEVAEKLIAKGVASGTIVEIMLTLLPQALGITIPMALLIGVLIALGRLSGDREAVALQACGVSLYRMLLPVTLFALAATAATAYVMIVALPDANQRYREITYNIIAARAESEVRPRVFFDDFPNMVLYVRDVPQDGSGWTDVFLADTTSPLQPDVYVARRGRMLLDREQRRVEVLLEDGERHRTSADDPEQYEVLRFERLTLSLDPETVFPRTGPQRGMRELSLAELQAEAAALEAQGQSPHVPVMEMQKKFSIPAACLVFGLIGVALGITSRKDGKLASFVVGIGVIFVYYVVMYTSEAMAKGGEVSPSLAMWIPNIVLGGFGAAGLLWRSRSMDRSLAIPLPFIRRRGGADSAAAPRNGQAGRPAAADGGRGSGRVVVVLRVPQLSLPGWTLLDRYISRQYLRVFGIGFIGLLSIFYIATFIDLSDKLFKGQTTTGMLAQYFWFATPQYVYYVVPIAALVATLVTIGIMTKTSEIVVMKACGVSIYRAALPLFVFGGIWSLLLFGIQETVLGTANRRADQVRHVIRGGSPQTFDILNRKWVASKAGDVYHYVYFDPERRLLDGVPVRGQLNGLTIYDLDADDWKLGRRIFTARAGFNRSWQARDGWVREFGEDAQSTAFARFGSRELIFEGPDYFVTEQPEAERMTYQQLKRYMVDLRAAGFNVIPYRVALQRKLAFPFVTVIMTLIAVPFAVTTGKRGALYGIGIGLVLAITYWVVISVFGAIGNAGLLAPALSAWAPNVMFAGGAAYLLLVVRT